MNLILLRDEELLGPDRARLRNDRAQHLIGVLGCEAGRRLRVGRPDGPLGWAEVVEVRKAAAEVELRFGLEGAIPERPRFDLILAMPRPLVLRRLLEHVAALGVSRILLTNAARVEKSYFQSALLKEAEYQEHLLRGLEQAGCTRVPRLEVFERFRPLVEGHLDSLLGGARRLVAHPRSDRRLATVKFTAGERVALAIGPEGGWQDFELDLFAGEGFEAASLGRRILRVETACTAALAQLDILVPSAAHSG
ncbi:MAG: 16S rRNA (uracil(1498)-N(3))-methyltransferase [Planctomycetota bacterium]